MDVLGKNGRFYIKASTRKHVQDNSYLPGNVSVIFWLVCKVGLGMLRFEVKFTKKSPKLLRIILLTFLKVFFFQKVKFVFQISQSPKKIIPKNYPELEI